MKAAHRPLRERPADFRETFIAIGWGGIEKHYGAHARAIRRWIDEEGREELVAARAEHVRNAQEQMRELRQKLTREFLARVSAG